MLSSLFSINSVFLLLLLNFFVCKFWCLCQVVYLPTMLGNSSGGSHWNLRLPLAYWWILCLFNEAHIQWCRGEAKCALMVLSSSIIGILRLSIPCSPGSELLPGTEVPMSLLLHCSKGKQAHLPWNTSFFSGCFLHPVWSGNTPEPHPPRTTDLLSVVGLLLFYYEYKKFSFAELE